MSLVQIGLILDALGVAMIYFFAFDIPFYKGKLTANLVVGPRDDDKRVESFYKFYKPRLFDGSPDWLKLIVSDLGLVFVLAGFGLQFFGQK